MAALQAADRIRLVQLLSSLPDFASEASRRRLLELSGLDNLARMIDLSGSPFIAAATLVDYLSDYGRIDEQREALGVFLNLLTTTIVGNEQKRELRGLVERYSLMTPVAPQPQPSPWLDEEPPEKVSEKIIGLNTLRPVAFLAEGARVAKSVAYIEVAYGAASWSGTGFLISPSTLLTNAHVIPDQDHAFTATITFNYQNDTQGRALPISTFRPAPDTLFVTSKELDYSILALQGEPGGDWGWLPLDEHPIRVGDRVNIVQHPGGQPKQVALQSNFVEAVSAKVIQYVTSTLPGSSGAPVLDDSWHVVGLHHAGGNLTDPASGSVFFRNEGIRITAILADLSPATKELMVVT